MIIDELNKKISDIENLANDKTGSLESKVNDLTDGILMVADAVDTIPELVDEKLAVVTKEITAVKDEVKKVKTQKGNDGKDGRDGSNGIDGLDGKDGKDGSPDTGEQIAEKLNELEGVLDTKVLKDFEMPNIKDLERQINTIGNQTLRLLSKPTTTTTGNTFTGVTTDATLIGLGTEASPLSVVATSASDVAITVRAATTAALAGSPVYDNGTAGVGATLTRGTNGILPNQDGRTLIVGDRLLVKNQSTTLQNGIYEVTSVGSASSKWVLTRTTDADETSELDELVVTVSEGSTNRGTVWGQQTNNPVVGTNAITFATTVSTSVTQATSGTQVINQIPLYTGTARQLTRGTSNFKYNPTNDLFTIRGIDYLFPSNNGDASQVLTTDGSGNLSWTSAAGGSPAGSNTQIQYNNAGAFGADALFTRDAATGNTNISATYGDDTFSDKLNVSILTDVTGIAQTLSSVSGDSAFHGIYRNSTKGDLYSKNEIVLSDGSTVVANIDMGGLAHVIYSYSGSTFISATSVVSPEESNLYNDFGAGNENGFFIQENKVFVGNRAGGNGTKITIDDVNEHITISNLPSYDDDTAAGVGGLTAGMVYMTTGSGSAPLNVAGILMIKQ